MPHSKLFPGNAGLMLVHIINVLSEVFLISFLFFRDPEAAEAVKRESWHRKGEHMFLHIIHIDKILIHSCSNNFIQEIQGIISLI